MYNMSLVAVNVVTDLYARITGTCVHVRSLYIKLKLLM